MEISLSRVATPPALPFEPSPAEKFFGLSARPFSLTPDLRFAYHSRSHTHALEQVTSALRRREGLVVVTGAIGTGKTMLCRSMLESFESRTFLSVILDPGLEVEDLLRQVLTDFGIISGIDAPAAGPMSEVTRHQFVSTLQQFLASLIPLQAHAVIMVDEAQRLNPRVLEEIRLLSNFETDEAKLLQIVLVGQPDLDAVLRQPEMAQLNQRVARRCELQPLSESEVGDYIERRLTVAPSPAALSGGVDAGIVDTSNVVRFSPAAVKLVAGISEGIPRVVNTLCDRALDASYERQSRVVEAEAIIDAAERLRLDVSPSAAGGGARRKTGLVAAVLAVVVVAAGAWWWMSRTPAEAPVQQPAAQPRRATPPPSPPSEPVTQAAPEPGPAAGATSTAPAPSTGAPATTTPSIAAPAPAEVPAAGGAFQIAVAAFKTESRAQGVAESLAALKVPATVRIDSTGAWFRVVAGPFDTREAAVAAQDALTRGGYAGTRISPTGADPR